MVILPKDAKAASMAAVRATSSTSLMVKIPIVADSNTVAWHQSVRVPQGGSGYAQ